MIPIAKPNLGAEEEKAVLEVLESGQLAQGPRVAEFEKRFAEYIGRGHGIAVCNGTAALHIALLAHGIGRGHEVVVPPLTFFASASSVMLCGGVPVFADVDRGLYNLDPARVKEAVTKKTKAVMPVHLYGQTAEMDPINEAAEARDLVVLEDACQAHGAEYHGRKAGNLGDTACFSFYPTKNMTTTEGGMIVTDDPRIAETCRLLRSHGEAAKYEHVALGYNYRMTEVAAAIGLVQLRKLDGFVRKRRENAARLTKGLSQIEGLTPPAEGNWMLHAYYQYIVRVEDGFPLSRDEVVKRLNAEGVGSRPSYPKVLYQQKAFGSRRPRFRCRVAEDVVPRLFELPVHPLVSPEDVEAILRGVESLR
jgi:perosamine synthetase